MNTRDCSHFRLVPWMTLVLFGTVWAAHLAMTWSGSSESVRDAYGLDFDHALTFLTYALIHADMRHVMENTLILLIFGPVVEAQIRRRWYVTVVVSSMLAGVAGAYLFRSVTGLVLDEKVVGLSAATNALMIVAIGVFMCRWGWEKWTFRVTLVGLALSLASAAESLRQAGLGTPWDTSAFLFLILGIAATCYCWFQRDARLYRTVPVLWVVILLMGDLSDVGWAYRTLGHLGGSVAGVLLLFPALRGRSTTYSTVMLQGLVQGLFYKVCETVRRARKSRRVANATFVALVVILVVLVVTADLGSANPLLEFISAI